MSTPSDYEKKLIEMRYQMQENQLYMQDTFKDLESWTNDIKEKEKKILEDPSLLKIANKGLPPIRNLATPKKKKKAKKEVKEKENKPVKTKLNSYDYRAWDKLDVDKLCEDVDNQKTSSSDYTTDEEYEEEQRKVKANWEKERGNQFFKDNLLNEAINCYTRAVELDPNNAIYPANRAMCLIKQEKYAAAENDCTLSIALDPNYAKAYHRRATCRINLKRYEEAKKDVEMLLKLEPNSKLAQQELSKLEELINEKHLIFPIVKKENEKSKKALKRIEIQEINDDESNERLELEKSLSQRLQLTAKEQSLFEIPKKVEKKVIEVIEEKESSDKNKLKSQPKEIKKQIELKPNAKEMIEKQTEIKEVKKHIPEAPSNGYQFNKDWQFLSNDLDSLSIYFKKINPNNYEKLFLNGLESDNLSKILMIYNQYFLKDSDLDIYLYMSCLSKTKRFQTQLMFLTDSDKKTIDELFNHLKSLNQRDLKDIEKLHENYKF